MSELRKDPVTRRWVIIASERGNRPTDFVKSTINVPAKDPDCPFCEGNEDQTPGEVMSYRQVGTTADEPGWWTRVVAAKNPLFQPDGDLKRRGVSLYDQMNPVGIHEIVVECQEHSATLETIPTWQFEQVLWAYRDRIHALKQDSRINHLLIVKNNGKDAGSKFTMAHPHSHLLGFPVVPKRVVDKFRGACKFFEYRERCIWCDTLIQEIADKERVVMENEHFLAFTPFASRFPFEICIVPKRHESHYENISKTEILHLANILQGCMKRVIKLLSSPAFNYIFFTAPYEIRYEERFHWHIEIMPRITKTAGFEWGTGFYINTTSPEDAAQMLREVEIDEPIIN